MTKNKRAGAANASPKVVDVFSKRFNTASTSQSQPEINADDGFSVNDGLSQLGAIRQHGHTFEAFVLVDDRLRYVAKAPSRAEALRLIREARNA